MHGLAGHGEYMEAFYYFSLARDAIVVSSTNFLNQDKRSVLLGG